MKTEEKERLIADDIKSVENRIRHAFNQGYELGLKDGRDSVIPTLFSDVISRKEAYDVVDRMLMGDRDHKIKALDEIKELPAVQSSQKFGNLFLLDECANSGYYCSECHKKVIYEGWVGTAKRIKYCPNCGVKITGVEN